MLLNCRFGDWECGPNVITQVGHSQKEGSAMSEAEVRVMHRRDHESRNASGI